MILKHSFLKYDLFYTHQIVCHTTQFLWDVKNFMHEKKINNPTITSFLSFMKQNLLHSEKCFTIIALDFLIVLSFVNFST